MLVPSRDQKTRIERLIREELSEEEFNRCKIITSTGTAQAVMQAILPFDPTNIFIDEYTQMNPDLLGMIGSRFGHMTTAIGTPHAQIQPPPYVPLTLQSIASSEPADKIAHKSRYVKKYIESIKNQYINTITNNENLDCLTNIINYENKIKSDGLKKERLISYPSVFQ